MARSRRGRGEAAVYRQVRRTKRADGSIAESVQWRVAVSEGHDRESGKRSRKYLYAKTKAEAQAALLDYQIKAGAAPHTPRAKSFVAQFAGIFIDDAAANRAPNTARSYEQVLRIHVLPRIGALRLDQLDALRVQRLYAELRRDGVSQSMQARVHVVLRRMLNVAKRRGLIRESPLEQVDAPRHKRPAAQSMTVDQLKALLSAARGDRLEAIFVLAATTGMRQGELFALRWDAVDLKARTLSVTQSAVEIAGDVTIAEPKSASGRRRIELGEIAVAALRRRLEIAKREGHESPYVFPSPAGTVLRKSNFLRRTFYPIREQAKIPTDVSFHKLRHTAASLLLLQGTSPRVVQELLGHADVRLTLATYSHVLPGLQRQAADALDRLLKRPRARETDALNGGTSAVQNLRGRSSRKQKTR